MKNDKIKIESDLFILNSLSLSPGSSQSSEFAIIKLKKEKIVSFKIDFDFLLLSFKNCEVIFDFEKKVILLQDESEESEGNDVKETNETKEKEEGMRVFYSEKMSDKVDLCSFYEGFLTENFERITAVEMNLMRYNIGICVKFTLGEKVGYLREVEDSFRRLESLLGKMYEIVVNYKSSIKSLSTYAEIHSLKENIIKIMSENKAVVISYLNFIYNKTPTFNFELKNEKINFCVKEKENIFYKDRNAYSIEYDKSDVSCKYNNNQSKICLDFRRKYNNDYYFNTRIFRKLIYVCNEGVEFIGIFNPPSMKTATIFGIEKAKNVLYIGNFLNSLFNDFGILMSKTFYYKGNFLKGAKNDKNAVVYFGDEKPYYKGSVEYDELKGEGTFKNADDVVVTGDFEKNDVNGRCHFLFPNGDTLEGKTKFNNVKEGVWKYNSKASGKTMEIHYGNNQDDEIIYKY